MEKKVNLLWTGGADSTFRLLELLLIQKAEVQTFYIFDPKRRSLKNEISAMEDIREFVGRKSRQAESLFLPTIFKKLEEIQLDPTISFKYRQLKELGHLGAQYEWLASFAKASDIIPLELSITDSIHKDFFTDYLKPSLEKVEEEGSDNFKLVYRSDDEDLALFKYFRFPIIDKTKSEMRRIAKMNDFDDVMNLTWFCHSPVRSKPCGICGPCKIAMIEGQSKRIPISGQMRNFLNYRVKPLIKTVLHT